MGEQIVITKEELKEIAGYEAKSFPTYIAPLLNMINRWASGTASKIVGQMSDLAQECPHKDYDKWKKWYLEKHPEAINNAVKLVRAKLENVKEKLSEVNDDTIKLWVEDLVIDKSFWGLKIQEAIIKKLEGLTGEKCRLATAKEEQKGIDGFVGNVPVQIKPDSLDSAPQTIRTEKYIARVINYKKTKDGDYIIDIDSVKDLIKN